MKKILAFIVAATLALSPTLVVFAEGHGNSSNSGKEKTVRTEKAEKSETNLKKTFKLELNEQKKLVSEQLGTLEEQKLQLETQYQELLASGSTSEADALLSSINDLDTQITGLQSQMKEIINERYMITKSAYSEGELAQFESAAALIEKMYDDAEVLGIGSVTIKNNIIKMEGPAYIKGGRTIIPVRAITEGMGAAVTWDPDSQSVTVSKDGVEIILTVNSTTVQVNGKEQQIDVPAEITNGMTYVPLRFIAETFGMDVDWDEETGAIDMEEESTATETTTDSAIDTTTGGEQTTSGSAVEASNEV